MGKAQKPLNILVHPSLANSPLIRELAKKGHSIYTDVALIAATCNGKSALETFDLVLGPNCWRMDKSLLVYIDMAVKAARKAKYGKGKTYSEPNESQAESGDAETDGCRGLPEGARG